MRLMGSREHVSGDAGLERDQCVGAHVDFELQRRSQGFSKRPVFFLAERSKSTINDDSFDLFRNLETFECDQQWIDFFQFLSVKIDPLSKPGTLGGSDGWNLDIGNRCEVSPSAS